MNSNDLGNRLRIRLRKSKDFEKTFEKLKIEGYKVLKSRINNKHYVKVLKDDKEIIYLIYEDINDLKNKKGYEYLKDYENDYKQNIIAIYY